MAGEKTKTKILVVDDQKFFREAVAFEMEMMGFESVIAQDGEVALNLSKKNDFAMILSDIRMPNWDGIKFLQEFRKLHPISPPFVFMTGFADITTFDAFDFGVDAFVGKPLNVDKVTGIIKFVLLPMDKQLTQTLPAKPSKTLTVGPEGAEAVALGRRGFCFLGPPEKYSRLKVNDIINFDIALPNKYSQKSIKGIGEVLWLRNEQVNDLPPGVGVEIKYLEPPFLEPYLNYVKNFLPVPVIPKTVSQ